MEEERLILWKVLPYLPVHCVRYLSSSDSSEPSNFAIQTIKELHPSPQARDAETQQQAQPE
jgi:hypothetical protein